MEFFLPRNKTLHQLKQSRGALASPPLWARRLGIKASSVAKSLHDVLHAVVE
ncbi:hypothetical protein J6590_082022 [Homalodisca vitripennis]|nr:hypothetical protein J6590_082022 [Homalodisca vitripennis]